MPDKIHQDLTGVSVHLADWPVGSKLVDSSLPPQDWALEQEMALVRTLAKPDVEFELKLIADKDYHVNQDG